MIIFNTSNGTHHSYEAEVTCGKGSSMLALQLAHIPCITQSPILGKGIVPTYTPAAFKLSVCGPPLPGGRLSQSQPEWMDPSPPFTVYLHLQVYGLDG